MIIVMLPLPWSTWHAQAYPELLAMQESKVPEAKLTKDVACIDGFEVGAAQQSMMICTINAEGHSDMHRDGDNARSRHG